MLVGIILVLAAVFRLGFVAQFISEPVLTGFKAGIGLVIIVDQAPKLFGLHVQKGSVLQTIAALVQGLPDSSQPTLVLVGRDDRADAAARPVRAACAPAPLLAVALGIAASGLMGLKARGVDTIGAIPPGLPGSRSLTSVCSRHCGLARSASRS